MSHDPDCERRLDQFFEDALEEASLGLVSLQDHQVDLLHAGREALQGRRWQRQQLAEFAVAVAARVSRQEVSA